ncbi:MAG: ECF transporter S component [Clostridia bacterium]|nr:ECF transporter S component [Clostridia bacterium]
MKNSHKIALYGVLMALTVIMTMVIQIPLPSSAGYLNLGDMVIFLTAILLGKKAGFIVGGIGSALADILLGWGFYAPITFIAKGLEGFVAGWLLETHWGKKYPIIPTLIGGIIMASSYYFAEIFMYGAKAALVNLPANIGQGTFGAMVAITIYTLIKGRIPGLKLK